MSFYRISKRLILDTYNLEDAQALCDNIANKNVMKYLVSVPDPYGLNEAYQFINAQNQALKNKEALNLVIREIFSDKLIGGIGLNFLEDKKLAELSYWISEENWNKDYASEASLLMLDIAFNDLRFKKVKANCYPENLASEKVMLKIGMKKVAKGEFIKVRDKKEEFFMLYEITKDEFLKTSIASIYNN